MGADCKSAGSAFSGSNPLPTTSSRTAIRCPEIKVVTVNFQDCRLLMSFSTSLLYFRHIWRIRWHLILAIVLLVASIPSIFVFPRNFSASVAVFGALVSVASVIVEFRKTQRAEQEFLFVDSTVLNQKGLKVDRSLLKAGYTIRNSGSKTILVSKAVNNFLGNGGKIKFSYLDDRWELPKVLRDEWIGRLLQKARREKRIVFDSGKVRLQNDLALSNSGKTIEIKVQPTSYLHGFWTNEAAMLDLKQESSTVFQGDSLYMLENTVSALIDSQCANSIGVSTLLIGYGSKLPLVTQSARSAVSNSKIAPSGSGSMDLEDIRKDDLDFNEVVCRAAERELIEEMGLPSGIKLKSQVIGYCRLLSRGGKPEFFCVTWLESEIQNNQLSRIEKLFTHHAAAAAVDWGEPWRNIASRLRSLAKTNESTYSLSLQCSLDFLAEALLSARTDAPFAQALSAIAEDRSRPGKKK